MDEKEERIRKIEIEEETVKKIIHYTLVENREILKTAFRLKIEFGLSMDETLDYIHKAIEKRLNNDD